MLFWMILAAFVAPVLFAVFATQADEDIAMHGGFHKKHL